MKPFTATLVNTLGVVDLNNTALDSDLVTYAKQVQKKVAGTFFVPAYERCSYKLFMCLRGHPIPLGFIYISTSDKSNTYGVRTYGIQTERPINTRHPENAKESTNIRTAVSNAARYLTMTSLYKVAEKFLDQMQSCRAESTVPIEEARNRARTKLFGYNAPVALAEELTEMYQQGYTFKRAVLTERFEDYMGKQLEYEQALADKPDGFECVMFVVDHKGKPDKAYTVAITSREQGHINPTWLADSEVHPQTLQINALPERIDNTIPMLEMAGAKQYVQGCGVKLCEGLYFIEKRDG